jgi:hypothetical protein
MGDFTSMPPAKKAGLFVETIDAMAVVKRIIYKLRNKATLK